jgi:hypothetical protein
MEKDIRENFSKHTDSEGKKMYISSLEKDK